MILNRNVAWIIVLETLWGFGFAFITFDIISALIYSMGGSAMLVAIASTANVLLLYGPQLFVPYFQQRLTRVIGGSAVGQIFIVFSFVLMAIALGTASSKPLLRTSAVVMVACAALGNAFTSPFYQQLRLRMFPSRTRSASYSTVLFMGQIATTIGAGLSILLLTARGGPSQRNYFWCFLVASVLCSCSTVCYVFLRDPYPSAPVSQTRQFRAFVREYLDTFRGDRNLRVFLLSEWMFWLSTMGSTFMVFYAVNCFGEGIAPRCSFARSLGLIAAVPCVHWIVSRINPRSAIITFYCIGIVLNILLALPAARSVLLFASTLIGAMTICRINYLFHFIASLCPQTDKMKYYALCSAVVSPATLVGPLLGGMLLTLLGNYRLLFAITIIPLAIGLWLATKVLKDPVSRPEEVGAMPRATLKRMTT
jgi:MFS family permease